MGSDVVFDSLYLDRCLGSSCHLDTVMLLLLGDTFLMFRFVSVVFGLPGSLIWRGMIWRHLTFSDLSHIRCHTGAYFRFRYDFTDPHEFACLSPFTIYALRWWRGHYFMTILQLSLFRAIQPDLLYIWCHTRAYFRSRWDLPIFTKLRVYPHLRDMRWDDDVVVIFMMIL